MEQVVISESSVEIVTMLISDQTVSAFYRIQLGPSAVRRCFFCKKSKNASLISLRILKVLINGLNVSAAEMETELSVVGKLDFFGYQGGIICVQCFGNRCLQKNVNKLEKPA